MEDGPPHHTAPILSSSPMLLPFEIERQSFQVKLELEPGGTEGNSVMQPESGTQIMSWLLLTLEMMTINRERRGGGMEDGPPRHTNFPIDRPSG